jgi:putative membrane protein
MRRGPKTIRDMGTYMEFALSKTWHWKTLLLWTALSALLFASWWPIAITREFWDAVDLWVFHVLNATVTWEPMAVFWALSGDRRFDYFSALVIFGIYLAYISRDDLARFRDGVAFGIVTAAILLVILVLQREIISFSRLSPALALDSYHSIRAHVPWSLAKEGSDSSFPGDHATVAMIIAALWWVGFNWRFGLVGATLGVLFALPRMAAGAHWATDVVIGGGFVTLLAVGLVRGTPLGWWVYGFAVRQTEAALGLWLGVVEKLSIDGHDNLDPTRQVLRGMCVGTADLIPGVSGGTMALILGIYKRLITAIAHVDMAFLRHLRQREIAAALRRIDFLFLLPLGIGAILAIIIFTRIVPLSVLVTEFPEAMFGFFFGLIAASVIGLLEHVGAGSRLHWIWLILGAAFGLAISILVPVRTPDDIWFVFLCGMIAIAAMLVPGISGSFALLILGKYTDMIDALGRLDFSFLVPLAAGIIAGALAFSRAIAWLLTHYQRQTMLTVVGVLAGSLLAVWPFKEREYALIDEKMRLIASEPYFPDRLDGVVAMGLAAMVAGALLFQLLDRLAQQSDKPDEEQTR